MKKKVVCFILSLLMVISALPINAFATEVTTRQEKNIDSKVTSAVEDIGNRETKFVSVETQDVEVYVTDGYNPIEGVKVTLNHETATTDANGTALFKSVSTSDVAYTVSALSEEFGEKEVLLYVSRQIEEGNAPKTSFTVSFWEPDSSVATANSAKAAEAAEDEGLSLVPYAARNAPIGTLQEWVKGADLPNPRQYHTSVMINGKLYVGPEAGLATKQFLVYDTLSDTWTSSPSATHSFQTFASYNGKLYCFGMGSGLQIFDPKMETWTYAGNDISMSMSVPHAYADQENGVIYIYPIMAPITASGNSNRYIYTYSVADNTTVESETILPQGVWFSPSIIDTVAYYGGKLYIYGNKGANTASDNYLYALDLNAKTCQEIAINHRGMDPSMTLYNGKLFFFGGATFTGAGCSDTIDIYDITAGTWTRGKPGPRGASRHNATLLGNNIFYTGGDSYSSMGSSMYGRIIWYNADYDYWSYDREAPNSICRINASTTQYNGKFYVVGGGSDSTMEVFTYENQAPEIINVTPFEDVKVEVGTSIEELKTKLQADYPNAVVTLSSGRTTSIPVDWNVVDSDYTESAELGSCFEIIGNLVPGSSAQNTDGNQAAIRVSVVHYNPIVSIDESFEPIQVEYGTSADKLKETLQETYPKISVTLAEGKPLRLSIDWKISESEYNGQVSDYYTIHGDLNLSSDNYSNPNDLYPSVEVFVMPDPKSVIVGVDPVLMTTKQDTMLMPWEEVEDPDFLPEEIQNEFGVLNYDVVPKYASVHLAEGDPVKLPVHWNTDNFDAAKTGTQTLKGWIDIDNTEFINPDEIEAELKITVTPQEYVVWKAAPTDIGGALIPLETSLSDLNQILKWRVGWQFSVDSCYADTGQEIFTFCDIVVKEEYNTDWANKMGTPGEYTLTASLPDNFTPLSDEEPGSLTISVKVAEPSPIWRYDEIYLDEYQSVDPSNYKDIPGKVTAQLDNLLYTYVDVDWDWSTFDKNAVGAQVILGKPKNLPAMVDQSVEPEDVPKLIINVEPVTYKITGILSDNTVTVKSGLSLDEITQTANPTLTYEITSTSRGIDLVTDYTVPAPLEDEKNADYICDPANGTVTTDGYVAHATIDLPKNISVGEGLAYDEVLLILLQNEVERFRPINIVVREGTLFESINLPQVVVAELDAVVNGENETQSLPVQWDGSDYEPYPEGLTDDHPVSFTIPGTVTDFYGYINPSELAPALTITVAREYDIVSVTPARIPEAGTMPVNLGASLDDIYQKLKDTTVQVTLRSTNAKLSTMDVSFDLRDEDNIEYSPEALGEDTLWGHLLCDDNIKNPNNVMVEIAVEKKIYKISSAVIGRVNGVERGTAFGDIEMPQSVNVVRSDGETDSAPVAEWDGSRYNPDKIGTQIVSGTFGDLPLHLENPYNRQPKAFVTVVDSTAKIVSIEPMCAFATYSINDVSEDDEVPGYIEHRFLVKLLHENGEETEEIMSVYTREN